MAADEAANIPASWKLGHVAVHEVQVAAKLGGYPVEVLELADVVGGHPAVLAGCGVAVHAALVIAAQKPVHVELDEVALLLVRGEQGADHGLLPARHPRVEGVLHELQRLLLDVREARLLEVAHHVGRHPEDPGDLVDLELARLQELRLLRGDGDGRVLHALLQDGDLVRVAAPGEALVPALAHALRVFDRPGVLQKASGRGTVREELSAVLLGGDGEADGVLRHRDRAVAHEAVEAEAGYVQHVRGASM